MDEFVDDRNPTPGDDPPITVVASRRVKPGREREFEEWVFGILAAANKFPGYLGSEVLCPSDPEDNEYRIIHSTTSCKIDASLQPVQPVYLSFSDGGATQDRSHGMRSFFG